MEVLKKEFPNNLNVSIKGKVAEQLFNFMPHIALSTGSAVPQEILKNLMY